MQKNNYFSISNLRQQTIIIHCIKIFHAGSTKTLRNLLRGDDSRDRMPVSHGFAHCHDIGHDVVHLETPPVFSDTPEPDLHLIGYAHATGRPHVLVHALEIAFRRYHLTPTTEHTLGDERANSLTLCAFDVAELFDFVRIESG